MASMAVWWSKNGVVTPTSTRPSDRRPRAVRWRPTGRRLAACHTIDDLRRVARRRLPRAVFDYVDGGAEDEVTLRRNRSAFEALELLPTVLRDVDHVDPSTTVLGRPT